METKCKKNDRKNFQQRKMKKIPKLQLIFSNFLQHVLRYVQVSFLLVYNNNNFSFFQEIVNKNYSQVLC